MIQKQMVPLQQLYQEPLHGPLQGPLRGGEDSEFKLSMKLLSVQKMYFPDGPHGAAVDLNTVAPMYVIDEYNRLNRQGAKLLAECNAKLWAHKAKRSACKAAVMAELVAQFERVLQQARRETDARLYMQKHRPREYAQHMYGVRLEAAKRSQLVVGGRSGRRSRSSRSGRSGRGRK